MEGGECSSNLKFNTFSFFSFSTCCISAFLPSFPSRNGEEGGVPIQGQRGKNCLTFRPGAAPPPHKAPRQKERGKNYSVRCVFLVFCQKNHMVPLQDSGLELEIESKVGSHVSSSCICGRGGSKPGKNHPGRPSSPFSLSLIALFLSSSRPLTPFVPLGRDSPTFCNTGKKRRFRDKTCPGNISDFSAQVGEFLPAHLAS